MDENNTPFPKLKIQHAERASKVNNLERNASHGMNETKIKLDFNKNIFFFISSGNDFSVHSEGSWIHISQIEVLMDKRSFMLKY